MLFTVVFVVVLAVQMRLRAYVPAAYWLTVVVVSVTGTLYTDILTDRTRRTAVDQQHRLRRPAGRGVRCLVRPRADPVDPQHRDHPAREPGTGWPSWSPSPSAPPPVTGRSSSPVGRRASPCCCRWPSSRW
nr:hypothetical protein [Nocardioides convexus]